VHACGMHAGKHTNMCVHVGMRSVVDGNIQSGAQHAAHMAQEQVQQTHMQASMQGVQVGHMSHLMVKLDVGIEVARHPQHHLYHPDTIQGMETARGLQRYLQLNPLEARHSLYC